MSGIVDMAAEETRQARERVKKLEDAIKQLPIFAWNGVDNVITTDSPDLPIALENLINLAANE